MKRILTVATLLLAFGAPMMADAGQGRGNGKEKGDKRPKIERKLDERRDARPDRQNLRTWRRDQVLPPAYRGAVIGDPYRYGLYAPPRGHAWIRVGGDVYLTDLDGGEIVEVLRDGL